ncbi:MAG: hypothetical protein RIC89_09940, partial [Pseudomonadales bacterium]
MLSNRIEDKRAELIELTQALVRIPSLNPPGEFYEDCCHLVGERLAKRGFEISYIRANGTPGDSDRYPRWNMIARLTRGSGPCVHYNYPIDVVAVGSAGQHDPYAAKRS